MQVPDLWWKGFEGNIVGVNLSAEKGAIYAMQYDAVHLYADVDHRDFQKFRLPCDATSNTAIEDEVIAPSPKKKSKHIGWLLHDDYSKEEDDDGEDGHAAMGRVAPGGNKDGDDGDNVDNGDDSDERYDDFVTSFVTPKRRNKQMNKPKRRNKKLVKRCTRKKRKTTINPDAQKGRRKSTLV